MHDGEERVTGTGLLARLQAAFGDACVLERELGGAGMSRVFLAHDTVLGRDIVVKTLPPELIGEQSMRRFQREVALAVRLQHPHVVPVLTAGLADGVPYYTMPYVRGESLRERLARGPVPTLREALQLLREIAAALSHAHAAGFVHRDLKPANVLLSDGQAMVTDFGVARALAPADHESTGGALTAAGAAVGTVTYMAPEQAVGDPHTDHRADLYALGVIAYELLTGRPPFEGEPHAIVAAHLGRAPEPPQARRADVPAAVGDVVLRLLAKSPADRPASAAEAIALLDAAASAPGRASRRPRVAAAGLVAALAIGATAIAWRARTPTLSAAPSVKADTGDVAPRRVAVAPFANATGDPRLDALGLLAADVVTQRLVASGLLDVVSPPSPLLGARGVPAADPTEFGRSLDAQLVVSGTIFLLGDSLRVQPRVTDVASGALTQAMQPVAGVRSDPDRLLLALPDRVLGGLAAVSDERLRTWARTAGPPPSYEAYRLFAAGRAAWPDYARALRLFEQAAAIDSGYALAQIQVATAHRMLGRCDLADSVAHLVQSRTARLAAYDRAFLDSQLASCREDPPGVYRAGREMYAQAPQSANAAYAFFVGAAAVNRLDEGLAAIERFGVARPAVEVGPTYYVAWVSALHLVGRHARALEIAREGRRHLPDVAWAWRNEALALVGAGRTAQALALTLAIDSLDHPPIDPPGETFLTIASELRAHGAEPAAQRVLAHVDSLLAARPAAERAGTAHRLVAARSHYLAGRWGDAEQAFRTLVGERATALAAHGHLGALAARRGDRAAVERELAWLQAVPAPGRSAAAIWCTRIRALQGDRAAATACFREAQLRGGYWGSSGRAMHTAHWRQDLDSLRGYAPFEALVKPHVQ